MRTNSASLSSPTATTAQSVTVPGEVPGAEIRGLKVVFQTPAGPMPAVNDVDLDLPLGTITGLVGESGSGKSTLALAMMNAVPKPGHIAAGSIRLPSVTDMTRLQGKALRLARGTALGYVFQASQNSLNPLKRIGAQLLDLGRAHGMEDKGALLRHARELCERMGLDPVRTLSAYQHELSGGMRQRVGIVFALILNPSVLVLDEPTTALDMISQRTVLDIIRDVQRERHLATLIITHDIAIVADLADYLVVMYGGRVVEKGPTRHVLQRAAHPYTEGLIAAIPRISGDIDRAQPLPGRPPDLLSIPRQGCVFRERCAFAIDQCSVQTPGLMPVRVTRRHDALEEDSALLDGQVAACHVRAPAPSAKVST
ncbi:MAG: ABC transporter ATP-binding protein [Acidimicrobiales bacterium]